MSSNPFQEAGDSPEENERTVIRPMPGGRRGTAQAAQRPIPAAAAPPPAPATSPGEAEAALPADLPGTPLAVAAAPLLQLLARLRNTARPPDAGDLQSRTLRAVRGFEQRARETGVPPEQLRPATYAICASIDDVVLNTPWGAASAWGKRTLTAILFPGVSGEDRFLEGLAKLQREPANHLPVIELMYLCLSLGYMGRYRAGSQGIAEIERLRAASFAVIAAQAPVDGDLSPHWQGVAAPHQAARGGLPVWLGFAVALAVCGGLFAAVSMALNAASDAASARMMAAPPEQMPEIGRAASAQPLPPPPAPPEPDALDRLRAALKADIDAGNVSLAGTAAMPIVRVGNRGGFAPGSASLPPSLAALFARIGGVLNREPGRVQVISYTDDQPSRSVQFPSNFQLSAARAQAVRASLARTLADPARLSAEGRADADPVASNATAEGRERNRRIELVLHPQA